MNNLFGADGIRGMIGRRPLRPEDTERLGRVVASWLRHEDSAPAFLIGTDTRESCQRLKAALIDGLARGGVRVVDAGVLPTAAISYLIAGKGIFSGGAIVSASHNPINENGIKFFDHRGTKLSDETETHIEELFFSTIPLPFEIRPASTTSEPDYVRQYAHALAHEYRDYEWHTCQVVVDSAHGSAYRVGPLVLEKLGVPYTLLNALPNGTNINRRAGSEYVRLHPQGLTAELHRHEARVAFALDGDADRALLVDRKGRVYDGDMIMAMLARKLQREQRLRQDTVVTTKMSNSGLKHYLQGLKIRTRLVRNGDKYITNEILKRDLTLGGEQIGHVVIRTDDTRVTGDGLRTALFVISELTRHSDLRLSDLAPGMRRWPQIKVSAFIGRRTRREPVLVPGLMNLLQKTCEAIPDVTQIECRPASTEPVYRIMIEARSTEVNTLAEHTHRLAEHIQQHFGCLGRPIVILDCVSGGVLKPPF